jgi:transposase
MRKERKRYSGEEEVAILRRHLLDKVPVSDLCEETGLRPTAFYSWQNYQTCGIRRYRTFSR